MCVCVCVWMYYVKKADRASDRNYSTVRLVLDSTCELARSGNNQQLDTHPHTRVQTLAAFVFRPDNLEEEKSNLILI